MSPMQKTGNENCDAEDSVDGDAEDHSPVYDCLCFLISSHVWTAPPAPV